MELEYLTNKLLHNHKLNPQLTEGHLLSPSQKKRLLIHDTYIEGVHYNGDFITKPELSQLMIRQLQHQLSVQGSPMEHFSLNMGVKEHTSEVLIETFVDTLVSSLRSQKIDLTGLQLFESPSCEFMTLTASGKQKIKPKTIRKKIKATHQIGLMGSPGINSAFLKLVQTVGRFEANAYQITQAYLNQPSLQKILFSLLKKKEIHYLQLLKKSLSYEINELAQKTQLHFHVKQNKIHQHLALETAAKRLQVSPPHWVLHGNAESCFLVIFDTKKNLNLRKLLIRQNIPFEIIGYIEKAQSNQPMTTIENLEGHVSPLLARQWHPMVQQHKGVST